MPYRFVTLDMAAPTLSLNSGLTLRTGDDTPVLLLGAMMLLSFSMLLRRRKHA